MEIETQNGRKIPLNQTSITSFGRGRGFNTDERTVSRRHVTFKPPKSQRVQFQVIGKNPIWVSRNNSEIKVFRSGDEGEMEGGDLFCVSGKTPVWFSLKTTDFQDEETSTSNDHVVDDSDIDPVQEFGFLILGHEFDHYPQRMIRDVQNWDWFLEEARKDSDDDDDDISEKKRSSRKKRKNAIGVDDDEEWTGDSDDDREVVLKPKKLLRPNYSTRSKDQGTKSLKKSITSKNDGHKKSIGSNEDKDEDEEDETLGGFIVDDEELGQEEEEEEENDEDEEEEFDEDEVDE